MPPRPSRNLDRALIAAGRELFATRGCAGLAIREVADAAGVNLGMFHYHFKSRDAFLRAVLQSVYEEMYSQLSVTAMDREQALRPVEHLRATLRFMGRFVRANRPVLARVLADALCGEAVAIDFVRANFPRHLGVIQSLIQVAQDAGELRAVPVPQAMGFCAGSLAMPILFAGAVVESGELQPPMARMVEATLLSDAAIDQRIELALAALAAAPNPAPAAAPRPRAARKPRKKGDA